LLIDRQYRIRTFNTIAHERAKAVFGKALQEGSSVRDFVPKRDWESFRRNFATALRGKHVRVEKSYADVSPYEGWFEFHYAPGFNPAGRVNEVFFSALDITERKAMEVTLYDYGKRSQMLSHQLLETQENERRMVARELHDEIGQLLTGLKLTLATSLRLLTDERKLDNARHYLRQGMDLANNLIERTRRLSLTLRPAVLDDLGLTPALTALCERVSEQTPMQVTFEHENMDRRFPLEVETTAYRIVQEALTNAARHADVNAATVKLGENQNQLRIEIRDRGRGFDPTIFRASQIGNGLAGMHERVTLLGGQFTLESAPGVGTRIIACLPLSPGHKKEGGLAGDGAKKKNHLHHARRRSQSRAPGSARATRG
jgi:signal transduction histidine kinase